MGITNEQLYKNWMEMLTGWVITIFKAGKEVSGETFLKKLEEEFYNLGKTGLASGLSLMMDSLVPGMGNDATSIGKICDIVDESFGNPWNGYVENTSKVFEKHILACPVSEALSQAPEICTRMVPAMVNGLLSAINPKAKVRFYECLCNGDKSCHYRIEINKY
jgi:hypothetical protein